jgi:predicted DNA-binding transcriptional regulator AlpA
MASDYALTREEVAAKLGISPIFLFSKAFCQRIGLPPLKIGRSLRFRASDVERLLAGEQGQHERDP